MRRLPVVGLLAAACLAGPVAEANEIHWRTGSLASDTKDASPSYDGFRASGVRGDCTCHVVDAGAHYPGGWSLYASFAEGPYSVCHSYSGLNTLGALAWNPLSVSQNPLDGWLRYPSWEYAC